LKPSYAERWKQIRDGLIEYLEEEIVCPHVQPNEKVTPPPGWRVPGDVSAALQLMFAGADDMDLARKFLDRAERNADVAIAEDRFREIGPEGYWPMQRAEVLRHKAILAALRTDGEPEVDLAQATMRDLSGYAVTLPKNEWDGWEQSRYQNGLELLLLSGSLDDLRRELKLGRKVRRKMVVERHEFVARIAFGEVPSVGASWVGAFREVFDTIRNPGFKDVKAYPVSEITLLCLGALWDKHVVTRGESNWQRAVREVAF
jgi:hypothetical protein